jgi:cytochrome c5
MADSHAKMAHATPQEVVISLVAGLLAPLLAIFLIVQLILGIQGSHIEDTSSEAAQKATLERIKPFATLAAVDANAPRVERSGQEIYTAVCSSCHDSGALGAPKFDNKGDWAGRLGKGFDTLVAHAINGFNQMPARGGDADLSDVEVARAVAHLANSAGGSFKAPEVAAPAAPAAHAIRRASWPLRSLGIPGVARRARQQLAVGLEQHLVGGSIRPQDLAGISLNQQALAVAAGYFPGVLGHPGPPLRLQAAPHAPLPGRGRGRTPARKQHQPQGLYAFPDVPVTHTRLSPIRASARGEASPPPCQE